MSQTETKSVPTKKGFSDDVRKVIKDLKERAVNRAALINQLWEFWKKCENDGVRLSCASFSSDEVKEVSSLLLERVKEEKEGKEIAAVLAMCSIVMRFRAMRASLAEGLAASLVGIINSHRNQVDVVERGLFAAGDVAYNNAAGANALISLDIVSTLEKTMESYPGNQDVVCGASYTCYSLAYFGGGKAREVLRQSNLPKLVAQVKAAFPDKSTMAHQYANAALEDLARK